MPYRRVEKVVQKKTDGWHKKGSSSSAAGAKKYLRVLNAVEHGWSKPAKKRKG